MKKERGSILIIAMIALLAMTIASAALLRSVDTGNVVAGNMAFKEATTQMADIGFEQAYNEIIGVVEANISGCHYFQNRCPVNSSGGYYLYPNVSSVDPVTQMPSPAGGIVWSDPLLITAPIDSTPAYSAKYMIERMCTGTSSMQESASFSKCRASLIYGFDGNVVSQLGKQYYRITVMVEGPRNTSSVVQSFFGLQDVVL